MQPRRMNNRPGIDELEKQFDERVIHINRVSRVVRGGRRFRFQALVVLGDHTGNVGVGSAKGMDVASSIQKSTEVAKKNMIKVKLYHGTLPHESQAKVGGANVLILPAAPGTGIIAGGAIRAILEVAGVENAMSKSLGSSNRLNIAYATIKALQGLESAKDWITNQPSPRQSVKKADK